MLKYFDVQATKNPQNFRGSASLPCYPSSCGMLRRNWHLICNFADGLPGFIGPLPSTSLDESRSHCTYSVVEYCLFLSKYTEEIVGMSRVVFTQVKCY